MSSSTAILEKHFSNNQPLLGALWDLDGTILDCETLYDEALNIAASLVGIPPLSAEAAESMHGMTLENEILFYLSSAKQMGLSVSYAELEKFFWSEFNNLDWRRTDLLLPGVEQATLAFDNFGLVQSLATMSTEVEVLAKEPAASDIYRRMKHKVFWGDPSVSKPKPYPDVYIEAARRCGVAPSECIAFEDTVRGTASASTAGCAVVAIPSVKPFIADDYYKAGALVVIESLEEIDFSHLLIKIGKNLVICK